MRMCVMRGRDTPCRHSTRAACLNTVRVAGRGTFSETVSCLRGIVVDRIVQFLILVGQDEV